MDKLSLDKNKAIFLALVILWVFLGYSGIDQIYHQDEHRWAMLADGSQVGTAPHPPITLFSLKLIGRIMGFDNLRVIPFLFSILNLLLIYFISKKISGKETALIAVSLFAVNVYSLVAGLQIDIDGAILPFFILSGYYAYHSLQLGRNTVFWAIALFILMMGGFLAKLSFLLFVGAVIVDFMLGLYENKRIKLGIVLKFIPIIFLPLLITGGLFYYFNAGQISIIAKYAGHFKSFNFGERSYFELAFRVMKSVVLLSPLLLLPTIYGLFQKEIFKKYRLWYIYLFANLVFYLVIFDFSHLTVERYFMFMIFPSVLISAEALHYLYKRLADGSKSEWVGAIGLFLIFSALILNAYHFTLPLNPKSAYSDHLRSFSLNFLIPFSGGSGPIGFYFSALFILLSWFLSFVFLLLAFWKKGIGLILLALFIVFGVGYNILFVNEYLKGSLYGSPSDIAKKTVNYVLEEPGIAGVITYNDIAAYELKASGKYDARFYTAPSRDYTERMEAYRGHYIIVDFPEIDKPGRYWDIIQRCELIKRSKDKKVNSYVFNCAKL